MPALIQSAEHERLWRDLLVQSDRLTDSRRWPRTPGYETWAYDAADRVADLMFRVPRFRSLPFAERLDTARGIHRCLAWRTARGRAGRSGGRLARLDDLPVLEAPSHRDEHAVLAITEADIAWAFMSEGIPEPRALAAAARIARRLPWAEIEREIRAQRGTAPQPGVLRVHYGRDIKRHGRAVGARLGVAGTAHEVAG